jgi:shikimate dehydrogenase
LAVHSAAVLGFPVSHSLSPQLHRAAYRALGLDWTYQAVECRESELGAVLRDSAPEVIGYSCTMPLKRAVLQLADVRSEQAEQIGAGNTLIRTEAGWLAENTDWFGIAQALAEHDVSVNGADVVILGAGGTAQAALAALREASSVTALVRDAARTTDLRAAAERLGRPVAIGSLTDVNVLTSADVVIATLPAGAADPVAEQRGPQQNSWRSSQALLDAIYHPWPTRLAESFARQGSTVVSGASMLLHQAARQVELMVGEKAPVAAMRAALLAAAPGCGA